MAEEREGSKLTTNRKLDRLLTIYKYTPIRWERAREAFVEWSEREGIKREAFVGTVGKFSQFYINTFLQTAAEYIEGIEHRPIPNRATSSNYRFTHSKAGGYWIKELPGRPYAEFDDVCVVDGLPVVWEVKMIVGDRNRSGYRANGFMYPSRIAQIAAPICEYFGVDKFAYVGVVPDDSIEDFPELKARFREQGGILLPFGSTREVFQRQTQILANRI